MSNNHREIWHNGMFIPWAEANVHVLSQSVQRGTLAFDYMSIHPTKTGPAIFRVQDHIKRLIKTCEITGLGLSFSANQLVEACCETARKNENAKALKISVLLPSIEVELIPQNPVVSVYIAAYDAAEDIIQPHIDSGRPNLHKSDLVSLKIERYYASRRNDIIPPHAKVAANYTSAMMAKAQARKDGFDDILLLDENKMVAEASTSNIFIVNTASELLTPPADKVLLGITRDSIIKLANEIGIKCHEKDLGESDLLEASEVFLTATSVGVWPVIRIDQTIFSEGKIGPITGKLRKMRNSICAGKNDAFTHWLHQIS